MEMSIIPVDVCNLSAKVVGAIVEVPVRTVPFILWCALSVEFEFRRVYQLLKKLLFSRLPTSRPGRLRIIVTAYEVDDG